MAGYIRVFGVTTTPCQRSLSHGGNILVASRMPSLSASLLASLLLPSASPAVGSQQHLAGSRSVIEAIFSWLLSCRHSLRHSCSPPVVTEAVFQRRSLRHSPAPPMGTRLQHPLRQRCSPAPSGMYTLLDVSDLNFAYFPSLKE